MYKTGSNLEWDFVTTRTHTCAHTCTHTDHIRSKGALARFVRHLLEG